MNIDADSWTVSGKRVEKRRQHRLALTPSHIFFFFTGGASAATPSRSSFKHRGAFTDVPFVTDVPPPLESYTRIARQIHASTGSLASTHVDACSIAALSRSRTRSLRRIRGKGRCYRCYGRYTSSSYAPITLLLPLITYYTSIYHVV